MTKAISRILDNVADIAALASKVVTDVTDLFSDGEKKQGAVQELQDRGAEIEADRERRRLEKKGAGQ